MDAADLPALEPGKHYAVKIYDEQPHSDLSPHRQIRPTSLGKTHTGKFLGTRTGDRDVLIDIKMTYTPELLKELGFSAKADGKGGYASPADKEGEELVASFHVWLIESIEEVTS